MSLKNQIKTQLILFTVFLCGFVATFLYLFQKNYHQFNTEIFQRSGDNIEIIDALAKVDANLYIHKKALLRYLDSGNSKWLIHVTEAEKSINDQFDKLEEYNQANFKLWVPLDNYFVTNARSELEAQLLEFQKAQAQDSGFQRLFYLTRLNINQIFDQARSAIKRFEVHQLKSNANDDDLAAASENWSQALDERQIKLIFAGIDQLVTNYNQMFWNYSQGQNSQYHRNTNNYFLFLAVSSALLVMFALFILLRVFRFFYLHKLTQDNLIMMGAKDAVTGLFNRQSFETLGLQEVERAKRRGYHLSLLVLKLEPYDSIKADLGQVALDRVMFMFAEVIRNVVRVYDGLFRYDDDTFIVQLSETDAKAINSIVDRFQTKFKKTKFPIKNKSLAVMPQVRIGFSIYPLDADNLNDLYQFALRNLSVHFDAFKVAHTVLETEDSAAAPSNPSIQSAVSPQSQTSPADLNAMFDATPQSNDKPSLADQEPVDNAKWQPASEISAHDKTPENPADNAVAGVLHTEGQVDATMSPEPVESQSQEMIETGSTPDVKTAVQPQSKMHTESVEDVMDEPDAVSPEIVQEMEPEDVSTKIAFSEIQELDGEVDVPDVVAALYQDEAVAAVGAVNDDVSKDDLDDVTVMKPQQREDIITVDFDRPSADLATEFRKKQKERRQK